MRPGIFTGAIKQSADQTFTNTIALAAVTDVLIPIAASQQLKARFTGVFSLGATGGFRFNVTLPAGASQANFYMRVIDPTAAATFGKSYNSEAAPVITADFTDASAVAGNYTFILEGTFTAGATAGNVQLVAAQNNATANAMTWFLGSCVESYIL